MPYNSKYKYFDDDEGYNSHHIGWGLLLLFLILTVVVTASYAVVWLIGLTIN